MSKFNLFNLLLLASLANQINAVTFVNNTDHTITVQYHEIDIAESYPPKISYPQISSNLAPNSSTAVDIDVFDKPIKLKDVVILKTSNLSGLSRASVVTINEDGSVTCK